jgi:hypothetical protein
VIGRRDFADELPQAARLLSAPCDLLIYEKALEPRARACQRGA